MDKPIPFEERFPQEAQLLMDHCQSFNDIENQEEVPQKPVVRDTVKVGRNDPCPCGSGKKYKKCCN
jgi:uncharacterized protein YecA (UPF0149 family)